MTGVDAESGLVRARAAKAALWERVGRERGWVDHATAARLGHVLLGVDVDGAPHDPAFQVGVDGKLLPLITRLRETAAKAGWTDTGLLQWLLSPTTYLDGRRPVDLLANDPDGVVEVAEQDLGIEW